MPSVLRNKTLTLRNELKRQCTSAQTINCDSVIGRHLLSNRCANNQSHSKFSVLAKCRSAFFLKIMESLYIGVILMFNPSYLGKHHCLYIRYKYKLVTHFSTVSRRLHLKSDLPKCIVLLFSIYFLSVCWFLKFFSELSCITIQHG